MDFKIRMKGIEKHNDGVVTEIISNILGMDDSNVVYYNVSRFEKINQHLHFFLCNLSLNQI